MPVELFRTAATQPDAVFCDSSFILDVLTHEVPTVAAAIRDLHVDKKTRAADAAAFFHKYSGAGTRFVSSPYTLQEIRHVLAGNTLRQRVGHGKWKKLRNDDYPKFLAVRNEVASIVEDAWNRVQAHGILFVVPDDGEETPVGLSVGEEVVEAAFLLLKRYEIDSMDAVHIAMGLACGLEWFATVDAGWKDVAVINVFCDS